jgi:hypothetical protein
MPTRIAPLLPRFKVGVGAGRAGGDAGLSGFLFFSRDLEDVGLAALALPGFAAAIFEAFGAVLRRSDFVAMQPPDTRDGI